MEKVDRGELTYAEFTAYVDGLLQDHSSHTVAAFMGWSYVPTPQEVFFYHEMYAQAAMNRGKHQPKPPRIERPWESGQRPMSEPKYDPDRAKRRERLNERLGLAKPDQAA